MTAVCPPFPCSQLRGEAERVSVRPHVVVSEAPAQMAESSWPDQEPLPAREVAGASAVAPTSVDSHLLPPGCVGAGQGQDGPGGGEDGDGPGDDQSNHS